MKRLILLGLPLFLSSNAAAEVPYKNSSAKTNIIQVRSFSLCKVALAKISEDLKSCEAVNDLCMNGATKKGTFSIALANKDRHFELRVNCK